MAALDTNVLLRLLLDDDPRQSAAVVRLFRPAAERGETFYVPVSVTLEMEWLLRSRFGLDKAGVLATFAGLLRTVELRFDAADALEWALIQYEQTPADFADCLHAALVQAAGESPMWTFDKKAARVQGAASLA